MKKHLFVLIFIVAFGFILRFYSLDTVPPSPSLDEVSIGWNAFSIASTGMDEYGSKFPLLLRAYDDWRPAFYVYFVVMSVLFVGLQTIAVRLPSVFMGTGNIVLIYFLVKSLLNSLSPKVHLTESQKVLFPLAAALALSISPWSIYLSRLGHEVNLGFFLILLGTYLFVKATEKPLLLLGSSIVFALSLNSYQSEKLVTPIVVLGLAVAFGKHLITQWKTTIAAGIIGICIAVPIIAVSISPEALTRLHGTSIQTSHPDITKATEKQFLARQKRDVLGIIINDRRLVFAAVSAKQYIEHFNPTWLFSGNRKEDHKAPFIGLFYPWEMVTILLGFFVFVTKPQWRGVSTVVLLFICSGPLPAAITTGAPHAMRSYTMLIGLVIAEAMGIVFALSFFERRKFLFLFIRIAFGMTVIISVSIFCFRYFKDFPVLHSSSFQHSLTLVLKQHVLMPHANKKRIIISNENALYQSYMFYLFTASYDPSKYLKNGGTKSGGYKEEHSIDLLEFRAIRKTDILNPEIMYVGNIGDFQPNVSRGTIVTNVMDEPEILVVNEN